jgi:hypothetical protein
MCFYLLAFAVFSAGFLSLGLCILVDPCVGGAVGGQFPDEPCSSCCCTYVSGFTAEGRIVIPCGEDFGIPLWGSSQTTVSKITFGLVATLSFIWFPILVSWKM